MDPLSNNVKINTALSAHKEKVYLITRPQAYVLATASSVAFVAGIVLQSLSLFLMGALGLTVTLILRNREVKRTPSPQRPVPIPLEKPRTPEPVKVVPVSVSKPVPKAAHEPMPRPITPEPMDESITPGFEDDKDDDVESPLPVPLYVDFETMVRQLHDDEARISEVQQSGVLAAGQSPEPTNRRSDDNPTLLSEAVVGTPPASVPSTTSMTTPPMQKRSWNPFGKKTS
jgi:hypothetical protein